MESDSLQSEKIKEWMRSVLLVMSVSGIFKPSGENEEKVCCRMCAQADEG